MLTATEAIVFRDCWLLFGTLDDIGYSHSTNLGRRAINRYLREKYPDHQFDSIAYPGVFFMDPTDREILVNQTIADECNLIFASSAGLFDEYAYALEYPNVSFVGTSGVVVQENLPPNLVEEKLDWFSAAFVMGAVAATFSKTCGGFINAFEDRKSTWEHSMGFALGYRHLKPNQDFYIITMDNYFNPDAEVMAARQLIEQKNCDVLGRHTDPNNVDQYVYDLGGSVLSTARYVDMSTFVGDTVFTSQVWNGKEVLAPFLEDSFLTMLDGRAGNFSNISNTLGNMSLSPFTSAVNQTLALQIHDDSWDYLETTNPLCGQRWRINQEPLRSPNDPEACLHFSELNVPLSYLEFPSSVTYYDAFQDGGVVCNGGGKFFRYNADLSVFCFACPVNTYRSASHRAEETCIPCPVGTSAAEGSSLCTRVANTRVLVSSVLSSSAILVMCMAVVFYMATRRRDNKYAPKNTCNEPIAVIFTDIESSTTLWANIPEEMAKAVDTHTQLLRSIIRKHKGYEVKTIGDSFMVVHADILKAVSMATEIQQVLYNHNWGTTLIDKMYAETTKRGKALTYDASVWNGLRVRVGIAYGTCDGQKDPVTLGWDYYGTTVNTAARVESVAHGGQVLLTAPAYKALLLSSNNKEHSVRRLEQVAVSVQEGMSNGVKARIVSESSRTNNAQLGIASVLTHGAVPLRGLSDRVGLVELATVGFENRRFPPLRIETDTELNGQDQYRLEAESDSDHMTNSFSLDYTELMNMAPEKRMERLMRICMRSAGVGRCDDNLLQSTWSIYDSLKAVLSLNTLDERNKILDRLIYKWHLSFPKFDRRVVDQVGADTPKLLMLSIRVATVVLADRRQSVVAFGSSIPVEVGILNDIQEEEKYGLDETEDETGYPED